MRRGRDLGWRVGRRTPLFERGRNGGLEPSEQIIQQSVVSPNAKF